MSTEFQFDVFLSHSAKDMAVVRPLAERLRKDGLKVWFDEWELPVASVYDRRGEGRRSQSAATAAKIEDGLEHSRVLVLCTSAGKQGTLLSVKRPGVTNIEAEATTTFTSNWRSLLS